MKRLWIFPTLLLGVCALCSILPLSSFAQMMPGGGGMGYSMGYPGYGPGAMGMDAGQSAFVTVKYGEKVYDAVFGDLVEARISFIQVPADTIGVHYFDDGTHGDEIPYDGMPSYIIINRDTYLGPFAIKYKNVMEKAYTMAKKMGPIEFYGIGVATKDPDSRVTQLSDWERQMEEFLDDKIAPRLEQFSGLDDETYVKNIDPSLFESMEGMGAMGGGGFGAGSMFPDLPPPPGLPNPLEMQFGTAGEGSANQAADDSSVERGRFDPIGRAAGVAGGQLQATEIMNTLP